ncbi:MAG: Ni/Fe-hydrogenase, b-type cytochrome subunit [Micrococcales bacterium]|nr:Ni/Fe-hydrogenase, b-type cytochrome subunit [Micrococcales bacterium]
MTVSDKAAGPKTPQLQVGDVVSVGGLSHGRLVALASVGRRSQGDPVCDALDRSLSHEHPDIPVVTVASSDVDSATPDRRYSLVRVRQLPMPSGEPRDVVVMRGDLESVLKAAGSTRLGAALLRRNARRTVGRGGRPLAVAAAPVGADGTVGEFRLQGFVGLHRVDDEHEAVPDQDTSFIRVELWSALLRWQHWLNVAVIFTLSCTGYLIMNPSLIPGTSRVGEASGYLMGTVRFVHFAAGFVWLVVGLTRAVLAFTSSDRYLRWTTLWPLKSKNDVRNLGRVMGHYTFVRREAPLYLAHNPLQQLAYTSLYVFGGLQMASGFVLYGLYEQTNPVWEFVSTPVHWWGITSIRLFHAVMMFLIWAFVIVHVYMAVRADSLERHGGVSAMFNGGVFVRRGSKPVDAPEIE